MKFDPPLQPAIFIRRYKRFLVDVEMPDKEVVTVHCPNTGSMRGCLAPGCEVMLSTSTNPKRKYPHTLELTKVDGTWIGVNTSRTNNLVREAFENGVVKEIGIVDSIRPEIKTSAGSRLDFLLKKGGCKIFVEVKNCTLVENGIAMFPDAVTARGAKHLHELIRLRQEGHAAVIFFCVQRMDGEKFMPAAHIDPDYAKIIAEAVKNGVMALAYEAVISRTEVVVRKAMSVII